MSINLTFEQIEQRLQKSSQLLFNFNWKAVPAEYFESNQLYLRLIVLGHRLSLQKFIETEDFLYVEGCTYYSQLFQAVVYRLVEGIFVKYDPSTLLEHLQVVLEASSADILAVL